MARTRRVIEHGDAAIWFTGSGLGIALLMILGMIGLILVNGLGFFWPKPLMQLTLSDGMVALGEQVNRERIPTPGVVDAPERFRLQLKLGNRDLFGADFRWIDETDVKSRERPREAFYVERREYGPLIGTPVLLARGGQPLAKVADAVWTALQPLIDQARR